MTYVNNENISEGGRTQVVSSNPILSNFTTYCLSLCTLYIFYLYFRTLHNKKSKIHQNRHINGPFHLPIAGPVLQAAFAKDQFSLITSWCHKYGKIFVMNVFLKNHYFLNDPTYIQKLLSSTNPGHFNKPPLQYSAIIGGNVADGVICSDYGIWKSHRKIVNRSLSLEHVTGKINLHARDLMRKLLKDATSNLGVTYQFFQTMNNTGLKMILHIIMEMEITTPEEIAELHKNIYGIKQISGVRLTQPWLLLKPIWWLHPLRKENQRLSDEVRKYVNAITDRCVAKRRENLEFNQDNMEENELVGKRKFKCLLEELLDGNMNREEIFQEVLTMIAAGYETTVWSTTFLLMRLATNPECQEKCRMEIDELFRRKEQENGWKNSLDGDLSMNDLDGLEYLDRCVKESVRLIPVVPAFGRRIEEDLKLEDDLVMERGSDAVIITWALHRDPKHFPDPEKFDPDRFLPEECKKRDPNAYKPFSGGMRNCAGWKVALLVNKLMTALVLRHFVITTEQKWEDLEFVFEVTVTTKQEINLIFKKRESIK